MHTESNWNREFTFTDKDFHILQRLANKHTGISLSDAKRELVYSRLTRRLRKLNLNKFSVYCQLLQDEANSEELVHFTNAITTNLTSFFREPHHFEYLTKNVCFQFKNDPSAGKRLRIWSAGCSTGEEPYSIAMSLVDTLPSAEHLNIKILATDLDSNVLSKAINGIYIRDKIKTIASDRLKKYFYKSEDLHSNQLHINSQLKRLITFKQLNLMHEWPMKGPFDAIFCRNVVIYFDKPTQRILIERYANLLREGGYLFLGHSESLFKVTDRFKLVGQTIYQKIK